MGSTLSKAKQLHFKTLTTTIQPNKSTDSTKVEVPDIPLPVAVEKTKTRLPLKGKNTIKHRKHNHHPVGSISVNKRTKPKYKKVTKSIIGKPTNFKHTSHMGAGDLLESSVDVTALSNELNGIAQQINCFEQKVHMKHSTPPAPPPHLIISASVKKRSASKSKSKLNSSPVVPVSFQRRQYRKAVPHHHPNLGLVNALMVEIPTLRSVAAS